MHRRPCGPYAWRTWRVCPWERERGGDSRGGSMMRAGGPCTQPGRVGARADTWPSRALPAARCVMRSGRVHGDEPSLQRDGWGPGRASRKANQPQWNASVRLERRSAGPYGPHSLRPERRSKSSIPTTRLGGRRPAAVASNAGY